MRKQTILLLAVFVLVIATMACSTTVIGPRTIRGNGTLVEQTRSVGEFNQIEVAGIGRLYVEYGDEPALVIEAEENLLDYIETKTFGSTLTIRMESGHSYDPTEDITFYLTVTDLEEVSVSGACSISLPEVHADRFELRISGAGDVDIQALYANRLIADLSGVGNTEIHGGEVDTLDVAISGVGGFSAKNMLSQDADVSVSGLGSATVNVSDYLQASISGAGDISYLGSPEVDINITGLGSVKPLD